MKLATKVAAGRQAAVTPWVVGVGRQVAGEPRDGRKLGREEKAEAEQAMVGTQTLNERVLKDPVGASEGAPEEASSSRASPANS